MNNHAEDNRDVLEQLVCYMIKRSMDSGMGSKQEMIIILEDMIQCVERGTLETVLEYT